MPHPMRLIGIYLGLALALTSCQWSAFLDDSNPPSIERLTLTEDVMFDFSDPATVSGWFTLNDDVMGGVSQSQITQTSDGTAIFSGDISFENNGGFATIQANFRTAVDLSPYTGLQLRVRGDGKTYGVYLSDRPRSVVHQATFETVAGEWMTVNLPFSAFYPISFGRRVSADPLNPANLRSMSLIIEYKQSGSFALEVASIGVYSE